jgi:hypothetical protein
MKEEILKHLRDAAALENLYRKDKSGFRKAFLEMAGEMPAGSARDFWLARLEKKQESISWGSRQDWLLVFLAVLWGGLILKMPQLFTLSESNFYPRNLAFVFLTLPGVYFAIKSRLPLQKVLMAAGLFLGSAIYINFLPGSAGSTDSLLLACLHLPLFLWVVLAGIHSGPKFSALPPRLEFIRFNAEWLVMTGLMAMAGGLFSALSLALFQSIGIQLEEIFSRYFVLFALPGIPIAAAILVKENPALLRQVAPLIARVFSPLVFLVLMIYLPAIFISGKNPFTDREFLLLFNLLLLAVLALIFFSIPEISRSKTGKQGLLLLLGLSILSLLINGVAVSAIFYRLFSWGITANRAAVLGSNILIFINLLMVTMALFRAWKNPERSGEAGNSIAAFLPFYGLWAGIVCFIFPLLFCFR